MSYAEVALKITTSEFGPDAQQTGMVFNDLALTYDLLARYAEAERLYQQSIEIAEKISVRITPTLQPDSAISAFCF